MGAFFEGLDSRPGTRPTCNGIGVSLGPIWITKVKSSDFWPKIGRLQNQIILLWKRNPSTLQKSWFSKFPLALYKNFHFLSPGKKAYEQKRDGMPWKQVTKLVCLLPSERGEPVCATSGEGMGDGKPDGNGEGFTDGDALAWPENIKHNHINCFKCAVSV